MTVMYPAKVWGNGHSHERVITPEALDKVFKRWELFMPRRYEDGHRVDGSIIWSIGYGHAEGGDNEPKIILEHMELTEQEASDLLLRDILGKAKWVNARIQAPLTTDMFAAVTSLCYQFGQGRLDAAARGMAPDGKGGFVPLIVNGEQRTYPLADLFNAGKYIDAAVMMTSMNFKKDGSFSKGLHLRRAAEVGWLMSRKDL